MSDERFNHLNVGDVIEGPSFIKNLPGNEALLWIVKEVEEGEPRAVVFDVFLYGVYLFSAEASYLETGELEWLKT